VRRERRDVRRLQSPAVGGLLLPIAIAMASATALSAQAGTAVTVAVGTSALTVPWYPKPLTYRLNPAVLVGTDRLLNSGGGWRLSFAVNVGFLRNHWWLSGVSLAPEVGVGRSLPADLYADLRLGLGYLHYFWRRKTLKLRDGRYVPVRDSGSPSVILPLSATLGYRGSAETPLQASPFVSARWVIQKPFFRGAPVVSHLLFLGGVRLEREQAAAAAGR